jgi:hypothetical protein
LTSNNLKNTEALQFSDRSNTIACNSTHLRIQEFPQENRILTVLELKNDTSLQKKCALCVHFQSAPPDLKLVMNSWETLSKVLRMKIAFAILESTRQPPDTLRKDPPQQLYHYSGHLPKDSAQLMSVHPPAECASCLPFGFR